MESADNATNEISNALVDWLDFEKTQRKIIARRHPNRPFLPGEAVAMRAAYDLLMDARISIITKAERDRLGRGIIIYIAERVK